MKTTYVVLNCFLLCFLIKTPLKGNYNYLDLADTSNFFLEFPPIDSTNFFTVAHDSYKLVVDSSFSIKKIESGNILFSSIKEAKSLLQINSYLNEINREVQYYNEFLYAGSPRFTLTGESPNRFTQINSNRAILMGAVVITGTYILHNKQNVAWWDGRERSFHIKEDGNYALYADKLGHFMGGYFLSYFARESFVYVGLNWDSSIMLGSLFGLAVQTYVEVKDGFAENTGFSPSDFAADLAGVIFFYSQNYNDFLQNFSPKWQYTPPDWIGIPPKARTHVFIDNYNSTTAWVSIHVRNLVWRKRDSLWPKWLNLAFGYGINGYYTQEKFGRYVVGIDFNVVELLPDGVPLWNWLKQSLNCVKLPAPAVEFTKKGTSFKLVYPLSISLGSLRL